MSRIESIDVETFEHHRASADLDVLDVRSASEYAARHVPGARHVPYTRLRSRLDELPSDVPLHVYCATGARAAAAVALLARSGKDVVHVEGAFASWRPHDSSGPR